MSAVVQVKGDMIGQLSKLVYAVGQQQREMMLEIAKELNKHNKVVDKAVEKQRELIEKVDKIEEKLMEKELYNYERIQEQLLKKKEHDAERRKARKDREAALARERTGSSGNYVMEVADNDDGFESCDEDETGHKKKKSIKSKRRTGDANKDYELDLAEVTDEEAKSKYKVMLTSNRVYLAWKIVLFTILRLFEQ